MKVTYVGDPLDKSDGPAVIQAFGETFEKGKAKDIKDDHSYADKIKGNGTFKVEGADPPVRVTETPAPTERDEIISRLTAKGQKVDGRASLATLQEQEAKLNEKADKAHTEAQA